MFPKSDQYVNIHAHRLASGQDEWVLTNLFAGDYPPVENAAAHYSAGLHPWHIAGSDIAHLIKKVKLATENLQVMAIGETGLDKLIQTPLDIQLQVFEAQVEIAEQSNLPVIIHAVRSYNELMEFMKAHRPAVAMIIHGFSGSIQIAGDLLKAGYYLSFGSRLWTSDKLKEVVAHIPIGKIFMETDEAALDIRELYEVISELKDVSVESLKALICENAKQIFGGK